MKLSNVLDEVRKEVVARVRSVEDSASYGVTEIMATRYRVNTEDGTFVVVRIPEARRFLKDPLGYLLQAEWSSREGFPLEISIHQDEVILKPCSTAPTVMSMGLDTPDDESRVSTGGSHPRT